MWFKAAGTHRPVPVMRACVLKRSPGSGPEEGLADRVVAPVCRGPGVPDSQPIKSATSAPRLRPRPGYTGPPCRRASIALGAGPPQSALLRPPSGGPCRCGRCARRSLRPGRQLEQRHESGWPASLKVRPNTGAAGSAPSGWIPRPARAVSANRSLPLRHWSVKLQVACAITDRGELGW